MDNSDVMFLDNYWEVQCAFIKEEFAFYGSAFNILSITRNDKKRVVNIEVEISDYDYFKVALKNFKQKLSEDLSTPYYAVQYKHNLITLFVKSQEDIYELEDYWFADAEFLEKRRNDAYFDFCFKQMNYWGNKYNNAKKMLEDLEKERSDRYDDWEKYQEELEHTERIVNSLKENFLWYSDKSKEFQISEYGVLPF